MESNDLADCSVESELARRIAAAAPGIDAAAEAAFCRAFAPRVRLYGRRHLRDNHAATDLAQQVMVLILQKLRAGELRDPDRVVSFIFGICRMTVLEIRRGERRRESLLEKYGGDLSIADMSPAPRLDEAKVAVCLEKLAERERTILLLAFYDEEPAQQIAASLGITEGNVRVIRHRALVRLRACVLGTKPDTEA